MNSETREKLDRLLDAKSDVSMVQASQNEVSLYIHAAKISFVRNIPHLIYFHYVIGNGVGDKYGIFIRVSTYDG